MFTKTRADTQLVAQARKQTAAAIIASGLKLEFRFLSLSLLQVLLELANGGLRLSLLVDVEVQVGVIFQWRPHQSAPSLFARTAARHKHTHTSHPVGYPPYLLRLLSRQTWS